MAAKHASVKLTTDFLNDARREADAFNRSLAAQVEHWARIGRAVENTPGIGIRQIREVLGGRLKLEDLGAFAQDTVMEDFEVLFDAEAEKQYAELGAKPGAVGRDDRGRLVKRDASGRLRALG